jgi:general secretion pathway protein J
LAIFSLISVMAYSGLRAAQTASARVQEAGDRLSQLQVAFALLGRDMQQTINRPVRDAFGQALPAFLGAKAAVGEIVELTRTGLRNPAAFSRSNLQRVAYRVEEDKLIRMTWASLDRPYGATAQETAILRGVKSVEMRFLDLERRWQDQWPPLQAAEAPEVPLPIAVEVTMDIEGVGKVIRLFRTAGDAPPLAAMMQGVPGAGQDNKDADATDARRRRDSRQNQPPPEPEPQIEDNPPADGDLSGDSQDTAADVPLNGDQP